MELQEQIRLKNRRDVEQQVQGCAPVRFNRQILRYLGANALSVYEIIINISGFAQCCAYSVGQAAQPMISTNFGAGKGDRIV